MNYRVIVHVGNVSSYFYVESWTEVQALMEWYQALYAPHEYTLEWKGEI